MNFDKTVRVRSPELERHMRLNRLHPVLNLIIFFVSFVASLFLVFFLNTIIPRWAFLPLWISGSFIWAMLLINMVIYFTSIVKYNRSVL